MRGVKRFLAVLMLVVVVLMIFGFVLENQQAISLSFLGFSTAQMPVAVYIVLALIGGMMIGPLLGVRVWRKYRSPAKGEL